MRMAEGTEKPPHFIRQWRKSRGWTLEQLAERVGMTHQNLGKIERFQVPYNQPLLERLAEVFATEPASIIMRDPSDPDGIWSIWDNVPIQERGRAAAMLTVFIGGKAKSDDG